MCLQKYLRVLMLMGLLIVVPMVWLHAQANESKSFLYVSLRNDNKINIYALNKENGSPELVYAQGVSGGPASLALSPSKKYLYVAQRSANRISAYQINHENGSLTPINSIAAIDNPVYLTTDRSGSFLLAAYFGASKMAVFAINADGSLSSTPVQVSNTGVNPHAVVTDANNRYLYVSNMTGNAIQQFNFDARNGSFSPLKPAEVVPPTGTGPRHMVFHGSKPLLYVVNELGNSVTVYKHDSLLGVLSAIQTLSTLPDRYVGTSKCADIHITPDNRYLYASNRGHESVAAYQVDHETGLLTLAGLYPTVKSPREFDIDPAGKYLYAAGETSNNMAWYRINQSTGALDSLGTIAVGNSPSWVLAVEFEKGTSSAKLLHKGASGQHIEITCTPNPFFDSISISFAIQKTSLVKITISDQTGREIEVLQNGSLPSGKHSLNWKTTNKNLPNGIYFCTIETDADRKTVKLVKGD